MYKDDIDLPFNLAFGIYLSLIPSVLSQIILGTVISPGFFSGCPQPILLGYGTSFKNVVDLLFNVLIKSCFNVHLGKQKVVVRPVNKLQNEKLDCVCQGQPSIFLVTLP